MSEMTIFKITLCVGLALGAQRSSFAFPKPFVLNENFLKFNKIYVIFNSDSTSANFTLPRCFLRSKIVYFSL
jgi:hypothetical protein